MDAPKPSPSNDNHPLRQEPTRQPPERTRARVGARVDGRAPRPPRSGSTRCRLGAPAALAISVVIHGGLLAAAQLLPAEWMLRTAAERPAQPEPMLVLLVGSSGDAAASSRGTQMPQARGADTVEATKKAAEEAPNIGLSPDFDQAAGMATGRGASAPAPTPERGSQSADDGRGEDRHPAADIDDSESGQANAERIKATPTVGQVPASRPERPPPPPTAPRQPTPRTTPARPEAQLAAPSPAEASPEQTARRAGLAALDAEIAAERAAARPSTAPQTPKAPEPSPKPAADRRGLAALDAEIAAERTRPIPTQPEVEPELPAPLAAPARDHRSGLAALDAEIAASRRRPTAPHRETASASATGAAKRSAAPEPSGLAALDAEIAAARRTQRERGADTGQGATGGAAKPAARASAPKRTNAASRSQAEGRYLSALRRALERHRRYPPSARRRRLQGTARVQFSIAANGSFSGVRISSSAGNGDLDDAALATVRRLARFEPIPAAVGRSRWTVQVPIVFRLN